MISEAILEYGTVGAFHCNDIFDLKGNCKPEDVHTFECQVNTTESSISFVGDRFPNLRKLKLNNSIIPNMRDIGCRFTNLRFLSLARCGITSLNGISTISKVLEELYLAFNKIDDCSELVGMDSLIVIDLEENNISNLSNIEFLSTCSNLQSLTLAGNPCVDDPETYRSKVRDLLPKLRYLDERRLQPKETKPNPRSARIRNEITYKKVRPKEPEPEKIQANQQKTEIVQSNESTAEKNHIEKDAQNKIDNLQSNKTNNENTKLKSKEIKKTEESEKETKRENQPKSQQSEKANVQPKEPEETKNRSKPKSNPRSKQTEKNQIKEPEPEKPHLKQKSKQQSKQSEKNQSKETEQKNSPKSKAQQTEKVKDKAHSKDSEPSKKVQIVEPPAPPAPQEEAYKVKEPQYENDDEVIITDMLDDLIEDRPPTARGNYESKFFKDSFELNQRNKTPVILKAKPHVITPRIPRNRKPRAISSVKKLD